MQFKEALELLKAGSRVRRSTWENQLFLKKVISDLKSDQIIAYILAIDHWDLDLDQMLLESWEVIGETGLFKFDEIIEELKNGKKIRLFHWKDMHLELDKNTKLPVKKHFVSYLFTPTFEDFCAEDWEVV